MKWVQAFGSKKQISGISREGLYQRIIMLISLHIHLNESGAVLADVNSELINEDKEKFKVYFLISNLGNGGQEQQLGYLARGLTNKGYLVKIFTWNEKDENIHYKTLEELGITVVSLEKSRKSVFGKLLLMNRIIRKDKPKVFQSFSFYLNSVSFFGCLFNSTIPWGAIRSPLELKIGNTPPLVFFASVILPFRFISNSRTFSEGLKSTILKKYLQRKAIIIGNALYFNMVDNRSKSIDTDLIINTVSVSRIDSNKRIDMILKVHQKLRIAGFNIKHIHAGDGEEKEKLEKLVAQYGLQQSFIFAGRIRNISDILKDADIFIHAADYEGSPNVIMEAMVMGLPIVSTNCEDTRYMLDEAKGGFVVPTGDWRLLAERVEQLVISKELRIQFGAHNAETSKDKFALLKMTNAYIGAYSANSKS
jgi:glycosyltransferase involved in cell wall biosynthesis